MQRTGICLVFAVILLGVLAGVAGLLSEQVSIPWKAIGIGIVTCLLVGLLVRASRAQAPTPKPAKKQEPHATFTNDEILHSGVDVRCKDARAQVDAWHAQQAVDQHNLSGLKTLFNNRVAGISSESMLAKQPDPGNPKDAADWIQKTLDEDN